MPSAPPRFHRPPSTPPLQCCSGLAVGCPHGVWQQQAFSIRTIAVPDRPCPLNIEEGGSQGGLGARPRILFRVPDRDSRALHPSAGDAVVRCCCPALIFLSTYRRGNLLRKHFQPKPRWHLELRRPVAASMSRLQRPGMLCFHFGVEGRERPPRPSTHKVTSAFGCRVPPEKCRAGHCTRGRFRPVA